MGGLTLTIYLKIEEHSPIVEAKIVDDLGVIKKDFKFPAVELGKSIARSISLAKEELDFEFNYDSGFIPKNLKQHLSVSTKDGIKHFYFLELEKANRKVELWRGNHKEKLTFNIVGFPKVLLVLAVLQNPKGVKSFQSAFAYAMQDEPIKLDSPLYVYPFPNVYYSGNVCMGGNKPPTIENLTAFERWFHQLPFGADMYRPDRISKDLELKNKSDVFQLFSFLDGKEFNDNWLVSYKKTYKQLVNEFKNSK